MIDYSNGYPVQITSDVTKNTPWIEVFKKNGNPFSNWSNDSWRPSNWQNIQNNPHCEDYKNIFLDLRFNGHIDNPNEYFPILDRFEQKYNIDIDFRELIDEYIKLKNMKWNKSFKKFDWKKLSYESNDLEKKFIRVENKLINIFSNI